MREAYVIAAVGVVLASPLHAQQPQQYPIVGRWDLTVTDSSHRYPSWLEVERSGSRMLVGRFVGVVGSARPVSRVEFKDSVFSFSIPPQWEQGDSDLHVEGVLRGDQLTGWLTDPAGKRYAWTANRAPLLRRASPPRWGAPIALFNGTDMASWQTPGANWSAVNRILTHTRAGTRLITRQTFNDFKLHIEFRYPPKGNSGVYLRGRHEVQIEDSDALEPVQDHLGAVYGFLPPSEAAARKPGEWQAYDITLVGRMLTVVLNGKTLIGNQEIPGITGGALDQINRRNVGRLKVAWIYHTGDLPADGHSEIQATPIVVNGVLYTTTPALAAIALRAASGTLLWRFDPFAHRARESHVNRGVVYWADGGDRRIFFAAGRRLYALDAQTGHPIPTFGDSGSVDLGVGLGRDVTDAYLVSTSPGVVYKDILIWGTRVGEEEGAAPGHVRAYDARTGKIRWTFHTIPWPGEFGYDTWPADAYKTAGGANSWAGMTVDTARGFVYIPTGSASPDFYGGDRLGANLFANSLLALDATTGKRIWHFQTVHHDLWDRDLPASPNLVTVKHNGKRVDAVAQITKSVLVFLFDRGSGNPLFPIEERAVPASNLRGERAWPTQPYSLTPAPFARQSIAEADVTPAERRRFR